MTKEQHMQFCQLRHSLAGGSPVQTRLDSRLRGNDEYRLSSSQASRDGFRDARKSRLTPLKKRRDASKSRSHIAKIYIGQGRDYEDQTG
jgi:hypothetical protein